MKRYSTTEFYLVDHGMLFSKTTAKAKRTWVILIENIKPPYSKYLISDGLIQYVNIEVFKIVNFIICNFKVNVPVAIRICDNYHARFFSGQHA